MRILGIYRGVGTPEGGAQRASYEWLARLHGYDFEKRAPVSVNIMDISHNNLSTKLNLGSSPLDFMYWNLRSSIQLRTFSKIDRFDIHHFFVYAGYSTMLVDPSKSIITLHDEPIQSFLDGMYPSIARYVSLVRRVSAMRLKYHMLKSNPWIHATGTTTKNHLMELGFDEERIRVIPNGFHGRVEENPGPPREEALSRIGLSNIEKYVVVLGQISYRKGADRILKACKILKEEGSNIQVLMIGKIESIIQKTFARELMKRKREHEISNFHITGYLPRELVDGLLWGCDAFLSASYSEACQLSLMEAAQMGLPIVSTDVGAAGDFFDEEGILIPRFADSRVISDALRKACTKPRMKYSCVEQFSWPQMVGRMYDFYTHVLTNR